jgi:hypothetical protein
VLQILKAGYGKKSFCHRKVGFYRVVGSSSIEGCVFPQGLGSWVAGVACKARLRGLRGQASQNHNGI